MEIKEVILKIIRTVLFTFIVTVVVFFFTPLYIYRFILSWIYSPNRSKGRGHFMAADSTSFLESDGSLPPLQNVILKLKIQGRLNLDKLATDLQTKFLNIHEGEDDQGEVLYPELKQYVSMCHGYPIWMDDPNFCLDNHLIFCTESDIQETDVDFIFKSHLLVPFPAGRSPWEAFVYYIVPDEENENPDGQTLILFKFHHALSDGYSIFFAITKMCCELPAHKYGGRKTLVKKAGLGNAGCCYSVNLAEFVSVMKEMSSSPEDNLFKGRALSNHKLIVRSAAEILFEQVRAASKVQQVSCTSIIVTCIANGIRRFMSAGDSQYMIMKLPFPVLQRSTRLRNQLFGGPLKLELDSEVTSSNSEARIGLTKKIAVVLHYLSRILYALPLKLQTRFTAEGVPGVTVSIFPGPTKKVSTLDENLINEIDYCLAGFSYDPLVFSVLTYNGQLRFWVAVNPQYLPPGKDAQDLVQYVEHEFNNLKPAAVS